MASLVQTPQVGQTLLVQSQEELNQETYPQSVRNFKNLYEIPVDKSIIYLNFIAEKQVIQDSILRKIVDSDFTYFLVEEDPDIDPFTLPDGFFYRCAGETLRDLRGYTYYYVDNGKGRKIPNSRTLEVMLAQRSLSYPAVRVLEPNQCSQLEQGPLMPDLSSQWNQGLETTSGYNLVANVARNINTLNSVVSGINASVNREMNNLSNQMASQAAAMQAQQAAATSNANAAAANAAAAQASAAAAQASAANAQASAASAAVAAANTGVNS